MYNNASANLKSGFEKCGIHPLNKERALSSIPRGNTCAKAAQRKDQESFSVVDNSSLTLLEGMRYGKNAPPQTQKRKRLNVEPGKSVGAADLPSTSYQGMVLTSTSCTESGEVNDFVTSYATGDYVIFMGDRVSTARLTPRTNVFNHNTTLKARMKHESNGIEANEF